MEVFTHKIIIIVYAQTFIAIAAAVHLDDYNNGDHENQRLAVWNQSSGRIFFGLRAPEKV